MSVFWIINLAKSCRLPRLTCSRSIASNKARSYFTETGAWDLRSINSKRSAVKVAEWNEAAQHRELASCQSARSTVGRISAVQPLIAVMFVITPAGGVITGGGLAGRIHPKERNWACLHNDGVLQGNMLNSWSPVHVRNSWWELGDAGWLMCTPLLGETGSYAMPGQFEF